MNKTLKTLSIVSAGLLLMLYGASRAHAGATLKNVENALERGQWNDAAEMAYEIIAAERMNTASDLAPRAAQKGAYALFQKGYSNAALMLLRAVPAERWAKFPEGQERLGEILSLFQKKVPLSILPTRLDQLNLDTAPVYLRDEIRYAKGRAAFESGNETLAKELLTPIQSSSRYYGPAHYMLGAAAVKRKDYSTAESRFSEVFQSMVLDRTAEFWTDLTTQLSTHWGANIKLVMNTDGIEDMRKAAELSHLALARVAYSQKLYEIALDRYSKVPAQSVYADHARLERLWTLLAMGKNEAAQAEAASLALDENTFGAIEARILRAIALTDASRTEDARAELKAFYTHSEQIKRRLKDFQSSQSLTLLPAFLKRDLDEDGRLRALTKYEQAVTKEAQDLGQEDHRLFPVYSYLNADIKPLARESRRLAQSIIETMTRKRLMDLERLAGEAKLVAAETYLEDRERLRKDIRTTVETRLASRAEKGTTSDAGLIINAEEQKQYDIAMASLLEKAIKEVDQYRSNNRNQNLALEFRQAEILWELATSKLILGASDSEARAIRVKALGLAKNIADNHTDFVRHDQTLFFTGYSQIELGQEQEGMATLNKFVSTYANRDHADDAHRVLADIHFDKNQFAKAEEHFKRILDYPDSPIVGYAFYKIGWCNYNLHQHAKSLLGLEKAVLWALNRKNADNLITLKREAKRDLIGVYAEVGNHKRAMEYFGQFFRGDDASTWIQELASELEKMGQFEKTNDLYRSLMTLNPDSVESLKYMAATIEGSYKLHNWDQVLSLSQEMVSRYDIDLKKSETEAAPAVKTAEETLRKVVIGQHKEFRKSEEQNVLTRIEKLDEIYLNLFGVHLDAEITGSISDLPLLSATKQEEDAHAATAATANVVAAQEKAYNSATSRIWKTSREPLYLHALLLSRLKKKHESAMAFKAHWEQFNLTLTEPIKEESLRNLISAYSEMINPENPAAAQQTDVRELLTYISTYDKTYPSSEHRRKFSLLASNIEFKRGENPAAIQRSLKLFNENNGDDVGKKAFKNMKVSFYQDKNWSGAFEWATTLLDSTDSKSPYAPELVAIREESLFLKAENEKDPAAAAALYMQLTNDSRIKGLKDRALYNAFIQYEKASLRKEALSAAERLEKEYPKSDGLIKIAGLRAAMLQEAGEYASALPLLKQFLATDKSSPADIRAKAEKNRKIIDDALNGKTSRSTEAGRSLASISDAVPGKGAEEGLKHSSELIALNQKRTSYERSPIPTQGDLPTRVKAGASKLESTAEAFVKVSNDKSVQSQVAFEAFCSIPFLYEAYAGGLNKLASEVAEAKEELEKIASPIKEKAKELAESCLQKATESRHNGPVFQSVLVRYGWKSDNGLDLKVQNLVSRLEKEGPWLATLEQTSDSAKNESQLLEEHVRTGGTARSWYSLARARLSARNTGLARLTLIDAQEKFKDNAEIVNALGSLEQDPQLLEKALSLGSGHAAANLAAIHLKGSRLAEGRTALKKAIDSGVFKGRDDLMALIQEVLPQ